MSSRCIVCKLIICLALVSAGAAGAVAGTGEDRGARPADGIVLAQAPLPPMVRPPTASQTAPARKNCRREPIWGFRMSAFCKPTGICSDRVIKGYRTVCS